MFLFAEDKLMIFDEGESCGTIYRTEQNMYPTSFVPEDPHDPKTKQHGKGFKSNDMGDGKPAQQLEGPERGTSAGESQGARGSQDASQEGFDLCSNKSSSSGSAKTSGPPSGESAIFKYPNSKKFVLYAAYGEMSGRRLL